MFSFFFHLAILLVVSYWATQIPGWPMNIWNTAIVGGVLYGAYRLCCWMGWIGGHHPATVAGGHGGGGGGSGISAGMWKFAVGFGTLAALMMVGTVIIGVSNNSVFAYFLGLGPRPWIYPIATTDVLVWVALFIISTGIAVLTVEGRWKPAGWVFGVTLIVLFVYRELPRTFEATRPVPASGPATPSPSESQDKADADKALAERGALPVVGDTVAKLGFGKPDPEWGVVGGTIKRFWLWTWGPPSATTTHDGAVGGTVKRLWTWAWGPPPTKYPRASVSSSAPAPAAARSCWTSGPCTLYVGPGDQIQTGWGKPVRAKFCNRDFFTTVNSGKEIPDFCPGKTEFQAPGDDPVFVQVSPR